MQAYSQRGNHTVYMAGVTPYIPGVDGVKNSLVGACELFAVHKFSPIITGIYIMVSYSNDRFLPRL